MTTREAYLSLVEELKECFEQEEGSGIALSEGLNPADSWMEKILLRVREGGRRGGREEEEGREEILTTASPLCLHAVPTAELLSDGSSSLLAALQREIPVRLVRNSLLHTM